MPRSKGLSAAWPDRIGSICAAMRTSQVPRPHRRSLRNIILATAIASPPLLAAGGGATLAQTTGAGDRYSGEVYSAPLSGRGSMTSGPMLSWPGKTLAAAPSSGDAPRTPAYGEGARADRAAPADRTARPAAPVYGAAPVMPWYERYAAAPAAISPAPSLPPATAPTLAGAPTSIYDPPQGQGRAATTPAQTAAKDGETARFYSLHRQYGLTPDPDPIPPQFFTQTADLSTPPGPSPVYKAATSPAGSTTAVHAVQSDDPTSTLGQP